MLTAIKNFLDNFLTSKIACMMIFLYHDLYGSTCKIYRQNELVILIDQMNDLYAPDVYHKDVYWYWILK